MPINRRLFGLGLLSLAACGRSLPAGSAATDALPPDLLPSRNADYDRWLSRNIGKKYILELLLTGKRTQQAIQAALEETRTQHRTIGW